ncbi:metallophosphoesterase family protein [Halorussus halobius]|uniref:metallophosphoesterase family protein n=1 Tax=Halorussus halobius TaxID=1710537 RepID=UPI001093301E|nr:metallophosphoesterase family protein [Halorussus halobius]
MGVTRTEGPDAEIRPTFDETVESRHERLDADEWRTIYVVGDVHGCRRELERLLDRIDLAADELAVFVGDLIRKGPDTEGVLELVRDRRNLKSVRGNNEAKYLRGETDLDLPPDLAAFVGRLPVAISWDGALVVHGGVDPRRPLPDHDPVDLLNMRAPHAADEYEGPLWYDEYEGPPRIFFGHTVHGRATEREHAVALDTGCVHGGDLTAYDCGAGEFVAVSACERYLDRSEDKIVSPEDGRDTVFR